MRGECRWLLRREAGGHEITENTLRVYSLALKKINKAFGDKRLTEIRLYDLEGSKRTHEADRVLEGQWVTRGVFSLEELAKLFPLDRGDLFRIWGE